MRYDGEGVHVPFLEVSLHLEWRHDGAAFHPSSLMVEFKVLAVVPAVDSLLKSERLLRDAFGASASDLGPAVEVSFLYPLFLISGLPHWHPPRWRRHGIFSHWLLGSWW
jgi:hypothetical protein